MQRTTGPMMARCVVAGLSALAASAATAQLVAPARQDQLKEGPSKAVANDPAWMEEILKRLDSDDLATRERASTDLQTDVRLSLDQLQARMADHARPLTPEQQLRLSQVALALFRETPRAAMGVSFARALGGGVELGLVIDQFDAKRVLKAGDVIIEMAGVPIVSLDDARAVIVSHDPGDEMKVTFTRNGEPQQGVIKLGSFRELQNAYNLNDAILREAWVVRCERLASTANGGDTPRADDSGPVDPGVTQEQWALAKVSQNLAMARRIHADANGAEGPELDGADVLVGGGRLRRIDEIPLMDFSVSGQRRSRTPQAERLQQEIENYQLQVRNIEARLRDPNLNEAQRQAFLRTAQSFREQIVRKRTEQQRVMREEALRGR